MSQSLYSPICCLKLVECLTLVFSKRFLPGHVLKTIILLNVITFGQREIDDINRMVITTAFYWLLYKVIYELQMGPMPSDYNK
jgi:hypothetical protein